MSLIHFTLKKNLRGINKKGILPGVDVNSKAIGSDPDKISFFKDVDLKDKELVRKLLQVIVEGKNQRPKFLRDKDYTVEDFILIEFTGDMENFCWTTEKATELYHFRNIISKEQLNKIK